MLCPSCRKGQDAATRLADKQPQAPPEATREGSSGSYPQLTSTMSTPACSPAERSKLPMRRRYW